MCVCVHVLLLMAKLVEHALGKSRHAGGITREIFTHAVVPLLLLGHRDAQRKRREEQEENVVVVAALSGLVSLRHCGVAPAEKRACISDVNDGSRMSTSSLAAQCAMDPLCMIFSYLHTDEYI